MYSVGKKFINSQGYEAEVIEKVDDLRIIKFTKTGNIRKVDPSSLRAGRFKNYEAPSVYGKGIAYKNAHKNNPKVYKTWSHMLERCYGNVKPHIKKLYEDVEVCERWLTFANFEEDAKELEGYNEYINSNKPFEYSLDKDIKGNSKLYSKENCMFATAKQQMSAQKRVRPIKSISEHGEEETHENIHQMCLTLGVQNANVYKVLNGERKATLGYTFERLEK